MKIDPLVSVIMPAYNSECYIVEAMQSVLRQTYSNLELIIINDASTDATRSAVLSIADHRIVLIDNEVNSGVSKSLNKGIAEAKGKYIARMDADDVSLPERISMQVAFMEKHLHCGVCGTFAREYQGKRRFYHLTANDNIKVSLLFQNTFVHPTVMFRTEVIKRNNYAEDFNFCEDYELWTRLSKITSLANIPYFLLNYRVYENSISFTKQEIMGSLRKETVKAQLLDLGLTPTDRELYLHLNLCNVYDNKNALRLDSSFLEDMYEWLLLLMKQNKKVLKYDLHVFSSILLFRFILACHFLKDYSVLHRISFWKEISLLSLHKLFRLFFNKMCMSFFN